MLNNLFWIGKSKRGFFAFRRKGDNLLTCQSGNIWKKRFDFDKIPLETMHIFKTGLILNQLQVVFLRPGFLIHSLSRNWVSRLLKNSQAEVPQSIPTASHVLSRSSWVGFLDFEVWPSALLVCCWHMHSFQSPWLPCDLVGGLPGSQHPSRTGQKAGIPFHWNFTLQK